MTHADSVYEQKAQFISAASASAAQTLGKYDISITLSLVVALHSMVTEVHTVCSES